MNSSSVLIYNPRRLKIAAKIEKCVSKGTVYPVKIIEEDDRKERINSDEVALIFAILSSCSASNNPALYCHFLEKNNHIPTIAVLTCSDHCKDCPIFQKYIWSFITLPFSDSDILLNIQKFVQQKTGPSSLRKQTYQRLKNRAGLDLLKGESSTMLELKAKLMQVATYDVSVLLHGETGTGKELCAQMIHFLSDRSQGPFVPMNCGALPSDLFENELFGHKKGAFTTANTSEQGLIAAAQNGTLFLDEVESLPEHMQVKLLRFLEEKKYKPLGQSKYLNANVRIIAAAKENLSSLIRQNRFRKDLFYRVGVVRIFVPALRDRLEDLPILVQHFIDKYCALYQRKINGISPSAMLRLSHYDWPGNIRELENIIHEAVITTAGDWIDQENINLMDLSPSRSTRFESFSDSKKIVIENFEKNYLKGTLEMFRGNVSKAARFARKERSTFCRLLRKYKIDPTAFRT
jgi:two-component system response regulator GlrR